MKPAFALSFSDTGISLHHQSDDDWYCIGTVPLDAPNLPDQMQALRDQGFALENDLGCALILPPDQVRLITVEVEGTDAEVSEEQIEATLASATPYDLSELVYVTASEGAETRVAAVARQTLDEASAFAVDHGFRPLVFWASAMGGDALTDAVFELPVTQQSDKAETAAPSAPEADPEPEVPIHAIAGDATPATFQSATGAQTGLSTPDVRRFAIPVVAASVLLGMVLGVWSLNRSEPADDPQVAERPIPAVEATPDTTPAETQVAQDESPPEDVPLPEAEAEDETALSATDEAILEALNVAPEPVEDIAELPETRTLFQDFTGSAPVEPAELPGPPPAQTADIYLTSVDRADLSTDTVALPPAASLNTDQPLPPIRLPGAEEPVVVVDEQGLVTPSTDGTLNPDGVMVYLGRPSSVPPEPPTRFEAEPVVDAVDERLAGLRPRPRPENLVDQFERQQLGGRSREELASVRPRLRPETLQVKPQVDHTPTALAVVRVPRPKTRPASVTARATQKPKTGSAPLGSTANVTASTDEAGSFQPKAVQPKIPTTASVARQATIDNALNLRKLNLIGVYGTPANRRALVRLPSGRYKKLKVGDRIDGGNVVAIGDSELRYQKRGQNVTLKMPRG